MKMEDGSYRMDSCTSIMFGQQRDGSPMFLS